MMAPRCWHTSRSIRPRLAAILREHRRTRRPHYLIEQESLGVTHAEIGAYLLATWGLPLTLVEAVAYHHRPGLHLDGNATLTAVHIADALIDPEPYVTGDNTRHGKLDRELIDQAALGAKVPAWRARVARLHAGLS